MYLEIKYLDIKVYPGYARDSMKHHPGSDKTSGVHVWLVLWKASRAVQAHAHRSISQLPIGASDFAVLEALLHKGPLPVNTIGKKVLLTSGSITVAVDRLQEQGLVERRAHPTDRRTRVVHLTRAGRDLIEPSFAKHRIHMDAAVSGLNRAERAQLVVLLKKLGLAAERQLDAGDE